MYLKIDPVRTEDTESLSELHGLRNQKRLEKNNKKVQFRIIVEKTRSEENVNDFVVSELTTLCVRFY